MPVIVPMVERALRFSLRWSTASVAPRLLMRSTWGRSLGVTYCRTNGDSPSRYRSWASACTVSIANEVLPLPLTPVNATIRPRGMRTVTSRRLWVRAPTTSIHPSPPSPPVPPARPSPPPAAPLTRVASVVVSVAVLPDMCSSMSPPSRAPGFPRGFSAASSIGVPRTPNSSSPTHGNPANIFTRMAVLTDWGEPPEATTPDTPRVFLTNRRRPGAATPSRRGECGEHTSDKTTPHPSMWL
nr:hypothetical protein GCM10020241_14990 [Streptoalloteichus tenebrarius]